LYPRRARRRNALLLALLFVGAAACKHSGSAKLEGRWRGTRAEGVPPAVQDDENKTTLVVHTDKDGLANKETFAFADEGKTMTWRLGEGRSIVFTKLKE